MRHLITLAAVVLLSHSLWTQIPLYDGTWMLGNGDPNPGILLGTFSLVIDETSIDTVDVHSLMNFGETNASICDSLGNLILYTNGVTVMNGHHEVIEGGNLSSKDTTLMKLLKTHTMYSRGPWYCQNQTLPISFTFITYS